MIRKGLLLLAILGACVPARAEAPATSSLSGYRITPWAGGDGITLGQVWSFVQDQDGYLWLGSSAGLVRFDGLRFATSGLVEGAELPAVQSKAVLLARDGSLWVGYSAGRGVYRIAGGKVVGVYLAQQTPGFVNKIIEDRAGAIWIAHDEGLHRLSGGLLERIELRVSGTDRRVFDVHEDRRGTLWVATGSGLYRRTDDGVFEKTPGDDGIVRAISEDGSGQIWVTDPTHGFRRADAPAHHRVTGTGMSLFHDRQGNLWVATFGQGLWKVNTGRSTELIERATIDKGLLSDELSGFIQDRDGNIWAGANNGIHRLQPSKVISLGDLGVVSGIALDRDGAAWVGSTDGLTRVSRTTAGQQGERLTVTSSAVRALQRGDDGRLWIATDEDLYQVVDERLIRVATGDVGPMTRITSIASGRRGELWVCDEKLGLVRVVGSRAQRVSAAMPGTTARPLLVRMDGQHRLWTTFDDGTLAAIDRNGNIEHFGAAEGVAHRTITAIHVDRSNNVWIGGDGGLSRLAGRRFQTITFREGLLGRAVVEIMDDDSGAIWVGLRALGFLRLDPAEISRALKDPNHLLRYSLYNASTGTAGLPDIVSTSTAVRDPSGHLWFVTRRGITILDPLALHDDQGVVLGQPRIEGVAVDDHWSHALAGAVIPPGANRLRIDYSLVNLSSFDQNRFRYRLDGFDTTWVDGAGRRQAQYTNLPPGPYIFRLQAADAANVWEDPEVTWSFSIAPAFYQARWFYSTCALALGLIIAGAWRLRIRQVRRRLTAILNERTRLSREIHDTLLQGLGGVALQLDAASTEVMRSPLQVGITLIKLRRQVEEYMREARQSIWDLRSPSLDSRDIVTALRETGNRLTAGKVNFALEVGGTPRPCEWRVETQVLRIAQEAVANAVRHANARRVEIRLSFAEQRLQISIADDGRGFDPRVASRGNGHYGLIGMQERATAVGGRCTIESEPGSGARIVAEFPLRSHSRQESQAWPQAK